MSLYSLEEICEGCTLAVFHTCCKKFCRCIDKHEYDANGYNCTCFYKKPGKVQEIGPTDASASWAFLEPRIVASWAFKYLPDCTERDDFRHIFLDQPSKRDALLLEVKKLCDMIVNSKPDQTVKGQIESLALSVGHHPEVLNAQP
jgi:hypothetical protein